MKKKIEDLTRTFIYKVREYSDADFNIENKFAKEKGGFSLTFDNFSKLAPHVELSSVFSANVMAHMDSFERTRQMLQYLEEANVFINLDKASNRTALDNLVNCARENMISKAEIPYMHENYLNHPKIQAVLKEFDNGRAFDNLVLLKDFY